MSAGHVVAPRATDPCVCGLCGFTFEYEKLLTHSWLCRASRYVPIVGGPIEEQMAKEARR